eukprot:784045-Pelagomonas_calceolata.AAC.1
MVCEPDLAIRGQGEIFFGKLFIIGLVCNVCLCVCERLFAYVALGLTHEYPHAHPQEGADRYNLGLLVKEASRGLCVPGYVHPTTDGNGWMYSNAM